MLALALTGVLLLAPAATEKPAEPPPSFESLKKLVLDSKLEEAEAGARARLAANPNDPDAHVVLANVARVQALDKRRAGTLASDPESFNEESAALFRKALSELDAGIEAAPGRRDIWLGLCQIAVESGDPAAAVSAVERAAARFPKDASFGTALRENARPLLEAGNYTQAAAILDPIAKNNPDDVQTQLALGRSLALSGKTAEGIAALDRAITLQANDAEPHSQRAEIAALNGDFATAAMRYDSAATLDPKRLQARAAQIACQTLQNPMDALKTARTVLNRYKDVPRAQVGDPQALSLITEQRKLLEVPAPAPLDILRVTRLLDAGRNTGGTAAGIALLLRRDRDMCEAHALMGHLRERLGQHDLALAAYTEARDAIDRQPGRSFGITRDELQAAIGHEDALLGHWEQSAAAFKDTKDPSQWAFEIGTALHHQGRYKDAAKQFEKAETGADAAKAEAARRRLSSAAYRGLK